MAKLSTVAAVMLIAATLVACAPVEVRTNLRRIDIANGVILELPSGSGITQSFDATQSIAADYEDAHHAFEAHLEVRPGKITIVALNALGGALFSIAYDGVELQASGVVDAQVSNARYVLADVLLTHWEPDWINRHLDGAVLEVAGDGTTRTVSRGAEPVIRIEHESTDPWQGRANFAHLERKYSLRINTVEMIRR